MNIQMPRFSAVMQPLVRFGNDEKARHALEMTVFMEYVEKNLDQMTIANVYRNEDDGRPNPTVYATLQLPNYRMLDATLYYDYDNPTRTACFEIGGTRNYEDFDKAPKHPPGRNLYLEHLRLNLWERSENDCVAFRSSLQASGRVTDGFTFWEKAHVNKAKALGERLRSKLEAALPKT